MIIIIPIVPVVFILIVLLYAGASAVADVLPFVFWALLIKNVIINWLIGFIKKRNSFFLTLIYFIFDTLRAWLFTQTLGIASDFGGGLDLVLGLIGFIFLFFVTGGLFLISEFLSITHAFSVKDYAKSGPGKYPIIGDIIYLILLLAIYLFINS